MTKKARESVRWVGTFKVDGINSNADYVHDTLSRLELLIIEQLPFTDAKVAKDYGEKLKKYKKDRFELYNVDVRIEEISKNGKIEMLRDQLRLAKDAKKLLKDIKEEKYAENFEDETEAVKSIYERGLELIDGKNPGEINVDYDTIDYTILIGYVQHLKDILLKGFQIDLKNLEEEYDYLIYRRSELRKSLTGLRNDIMAIQRNTFKGMARDESSRYITTVKAEGKPKIVIDSKESGVAAKAEKDKKFSENLVFANISFVIDNKGRKFEISIPVKIPGDPVVNLSRFKPAEYMYLGLGAKYDSSNEFLMKQIQKRFVKGAQILGIDPTKSFDSSMLFSHSEQALFSALLDLPEVRQNIAASLGRELEKIGDLKDFTVENMILDIHTSRYMCDNCATCAIGMQDDSDDKLSFKNLMLNCISEEMPEISIDMGCKVHARVSASTDFQTKRKEKGDHDGHVQIDNLTLSERDMRMVEEKTPYSSRDLDLLKQLNEHTLFTSGDKEEQKFKTAYSRAIYPLLNKASSTIGKEFKAVMARRLQAKDNVLGNELA